MSDQLVSSLAIGEIRNKNDTATNCKKEEKLVTKREREREGEAVTKKTEKER